MSAAKQVAKRTTRHAKNTRLKIERLSMRIDKPAKAKLERAAAYIQKSVSEYVVTRALEAAETDIMAHEKIVLPEILGDVFFEALKKPPKANAAIKALLKSHDQAVISR